MLNTLVDEVTQNWDYYVRFPSIAFITIYLFAKSERAYVRRIREIRGKRTNYDSSSSSQRQPEDSSSSASP